MGRQPPKPKVDNRSLRSKVELRRWLLEEMGIQRVRVLDACAGAGHVWEAMRAHVAIDQWVRTDIAPRQVGTLKLTAAQAVSSFDLSPFNVVDIDPYGEPWDAYFAFLRKFTQPTAVFLTRGHVQYTVISLATREIVGLPTSWRIPQIPTLASFLDELLLRETWRYARIDHSAAIELQNVSYYALGLSPPAA
jgi:hypothetical protein